MQVNNFIKKFTEDIDKQYFIEKVSISIVFNGNFF